MAQNLVYLTLQGCESQTQDEYESFSTELLRATPGSQNPTTKHYQVVSGKFLASILLPFLEGRCDGCLVSLSGEDSLRILTSRLDFWLPTESRALSKPYLSMYYHCAVLIDTKHILVFGGISAENSLLPMNVVHTLRVRLIPIYLILQTLQYLLCFIILIILSMLLLFFY